MEPSLNPDEVDTLLFDLCVVLGLCISSCENRESIRNNPPADIEGFIDAIKLAGGGDPRRRPRLYQSTRQIIARHLGIDEPQTLNLPTAKDLIDNLRRRKS